MRASIKSFVIRLFVVVKKDDTHCRGASSKTGKIDSVDFPNE